MYYMPYVLYYTILHYIIFHIRALAIPPLLALAIPPLLASAISQKELKSPLRGFNTPLREMGRAPV